jgi:hypothetical protein
MTRKDYKAIAAAFHKTLASQECFSRETIATMALAIQNVTDALASDNPRFDRRKFHQACVFAEGL